MTPEEIDAFRTAKDILLRAGNEGWPYVSLSPFFKGVGERRSSLSALADLTVIPDEISGLARGVVLELRGTQIQDLSPLRAISDIKTVYFEGLPACDADPELQNISQVISDEERTNLLHAWLNMHEVQEPPELIAGGPQFFIGDDGPIRLVDFPMDHSDDSDQSLLKDECERKSKDLLQIVEMAANVAPTLPQTVERYLELISLDAAKIGARVIWSIANSLEAVIEVHDQAQRDGRQSEELPAPIAANLKDLAQTHRVWFLGHPGAREVEARASGHTTKQHSKDHRKALAQVVFAASASDAVEDAATIPAIENLKNSELSTPAGIAAFGELEEWVWNFLASISRKAILIAKDPPGGFLVETVAGYYLIEFIVANEASLRVYASNIMSQGPLWWDAMIAMLRRATQRLDQDD